jgi:hypothetical protein
MRGRLTAFFVATLTALSPSLAFASGSVPATSTASRQTTMSHLSFNAAAQPATTPASRVLIADEPYNLGKAVFSGKYKFGNPRLTAANVAEKMQRLTTLQRTFPAAERKQMSPAELSKHLTDREVNALEYYLGMRFGKFITKSPSWAKDEPPPKVASAR